MPFKFRADSQATLTAVGDHINLEVLSNQSGAEPWDDHDLTIVDGQLTVITDTDNLCGARFIVANEAIGDSDLNEDNPAPEDDMVWYSFWAARGPLVFRLVSKKTVHPEHKLWIQVWKARGADATFLRWGLNLMIQAHN